MSLPPLPILHALGLVWLFAIGLVIGSFLNVVIVRLPQGKSIAWPGSHCPKCGAQLHWYDNVPLLSWLWLRAKCRACHQPISGRYPLVEFITGALFVACHWRFGWSYPLLPALVFVTLLVALTFIDLETWLLPFSLTLPGIALGVLFAVPLGWPAVIDASLGAGLGFGLFWSLEWVGQRIFKKEALGGGDKYLLAMLGAFLTHRALFAIVFLSSLQGSLVGLTLIALRGRAGPAAVETTEDDEDDWQPGPTNMPFGPWLAIAGLEVLLLSGVLARWVPDSVSWILFPHARGGE